MAKKDKKDLVLGEVLEEAAPKKVETTEEVTPEIVDATEDAAAKIKELEMQLADKEGQIAVLGTLTKSKTRGEVIKEAKTSCGTIKIYNMKE